MSNQMEEDFYRTVDDIRTHDLFQDISKKLDRYIQPYNPGARKSPRDATAREFYSGDNPQMSRTSTES